MVRHMADRNVETCFARFTWRMLSHGVSPWELERLKESIETWDQWYEHLSATSRRHIDIGDRAREQGQSRTAGEAYVRAGLILHWATFLFVQDQDSWRAGLEAMAECWSKAAPLVDPPMELFEVPFEGTALPGYLRRPAGVDHPPLVLFVPGGDSTKEELYDFGEQIVRRGIAFAAFDGPGHGLVSSTLKTRPDYEVPIRAVLDRLLERDDVDTGRVAVGGISYGGLFACRAAAFDDRIRAVVSASSWYTPAGRFAGIGPLSQAGLRQYMGENAGEVMDSITMEGIGPRLRVPLLQVYGGLDEASPPEHAYRVEAEVAGPVTTLVFDDGVHVCNNLAHIVRPLIADWLADRLDVR